MTRTEAQRHDWLVEQGTERFIETFLALMKVESAGGRTPGVVLPTKSELRTFFQQTTPDYWAMMGATAPMEAHSQMAQWSRAEEGA